MNEVIMDYSWLKNGCINDSAFNWMLSLLTAENENVKNINDIGACRKFVSNGFEGCVDNKDMSSHYKRFHLCLPQEWDCINHTYYNNMWPTNIVWITE